MDQFRREDTRQALVLWLAYISVVVGPCVVADIRSCSGVLDTLLIVEVA